MAQPLGLTRLGYHPRAMEPVGELVAAAVVDRRVWGSAGERAPDGIYLVGQPGPAHPFVLFRAWKVPVGFVREEVRMYGPSGRLVWRWGPEVRRMAGMFDLTTELDEVHEAVFDETGTYVASFVLDDQILGEIEVPVAVEVAPAKLPKDVEDGFRRSDVIWVGARLDGRLRTIPAWFAYKDGRVYVLSQRTPGPEEQTVPGIGQAKEFVIVTRRKGRDTALEELPAAGRLLEGAEWEEAAKLLVDRRRSRVGPPQASLQRWRKTCDIVELTPRVPADSRPGTAA
ncbi:MAG: hypothetical protein KatS3mg013_0022 [Actinomycetota bacterium]|nr:MAG: hypothetical protein KatS3mg013_0022 [Actinomycetota bacterium]